MGVSRGQTPRNNQVKNRQAKSAIRGLNRDERRRVHQEISQKGYGYKEIRDIANGIRRGEP